ncbi:MAG: hypothetical protein ACK56F_15745, partial [bacterium]
ALSLLLDLGMPSNNFIWKNNGFDVLKSSAKWRCYILLAENLILWIQNCDHSHHPVFVRHGLLVNPSYIEIELSAELLQLLIEHFLGWRLRAWSHPQIVVPEAQVISLKDID